MSETKKQLVELETSTHHAPELIARALIYTALPKDAINAPREIIVRLPLEQQVQNTSEPDEELVERLLNLFDERMAWILSSAFNCSIPEPEALEDKIRALLQSRKPVVTMGEIDGLIVEWMGLLNPQKMRDVLRVFLKSKGMEVRK